MIECDAGLARMEGERDIYIERVLEARGVLVWGGWTDPGRVDKWWGPVGFETTTASMDVRVGGVWVLMMRGPDGREYPNRIEFFEVVRPEKLVYSHGGAGARVTVLFEDVGGKTLLKWRMTFGSREQREKIATTYKAVEGLTQTVGRLAGYMGKGE